MSDKYFCHGHLLQEISITVCIRDDKAGGFMISLSLLYIILKSGSTCHLMALQHKYSTVLFITYLFSSCVLPVNPCSCKWLTCWCMKATGTWATMSSPWTTAGWRAPGMFRAVCSLTLTVSPLASRRSVTMLVYFLESPINAV